LTTREDATDNPTIRKMYDRFSSMPGFWELDAWTCRATASSPYRARVIEQLGLDGSSRVLDVACGTGLNFDLLQEALEQKGQLVGVDFSARTLGLAHKKAVKRGWNNVQLHETDAAAYLPDEPFDAALCTFAIEIIPPYRETLAMMINALKPGGRIGIIGFRLSSRKGYSLLNPIWRAMGVPFGGVDLDRDVRSLVYERCEEVFYEEVYGGFYYLLVAARRS
jgi:demethylmenaquinone methyltransferase/2-methoxy-6-polyprenyl-1,4-benzoquinol methylase